LNVIEDLERLPRDENFRINNADHAGNTIVSRITNTLGSLKTLSAMDKNGADDENRNFNLFTHHQKIKNKESLDYSYEALKEAVLELYLSVKIRSDEEIDNYNENFFKDEKGQMAHVDGFTLIDYIKTSIEILMNMKVEEQDEMENPDLFSQTSPSAGLRKQNNTLGRFSDKPRQDDIRLIERKAYGADKKDRERAEGRNGRPANKSGGLEDRHISIELQPNQIKLNADSVADQDEEMRVQMPKMASIDTNKSGPRRDSGSKPGKQGLSRKHNAGKIPGGFAEESPSKAQIGLFEKSPSSTVKDLQRKLD
jgi:hypothetical protein